MPSGKATGFSSLLLPLSAALTSKSRLDRAGGGGRDMVAWPAKLATFFSEEVQRPYLLFVSMGVHIPPPICAFHRAGTHRLFPHSEATSELLDFPAPSPGMSVRQEG